MSTSSPNLLDELERRARAMAERDGAAGDSWEALERDLEKLPREPPLLDPDEGRKSGAEFRFLVAALRGQKVAEARPPEGPMRAGYLIEGTPGSGARVRPAFAEALAAAVPAKQLADQFRDLVSIDARLATLFSGNPSAREMALAWLTSPGRLLVQDLSVLRSVGFSPGPAAEPMPPELLGSIPGLWMRQWSPADGHVGTALQILQGRPGDPVSLRGAALRWLLDRAAREPSYELDGTRRNLQDDLPPAVIGGFPPPDVSDPAQLQAGVRLERVCLLHGARLAAGDIRRAWILARWIQSCTFRSPFFGGDEEALAARLHAELPKGPLDLTGGDALAPSHFTDDERGPLLDELALVAGAAEHYAVVEGPRLLPTPLPLVHALRRVAGRTLNESDRSAERFLPRGPEPGTPQPGNALGWGAHHVAPPLVARWVMTRQRIAWMNELGEKSDAVVRESLALFQEDPSTYDWIALAVYSEGAQLPAELRALAAQAYRQIARTSEGSRGGIEEIAGLTHMAAGVLDELTEEEARLAAVLSRRADAAWRYRALEGLAEAAERLRPEHPGGDSIWRAAMDELLAMMDDAQVDPSERVKASLLALRRALTRPREHPDRAEYLRRIGVRATSSPFNENMTLRNQLRRQSVLASSH